MLIPDLGPMPRGRRMTTPPSGPLGRRVLVTGASRGIGHEVAVAFAAAGDWVAVPFELEAPSRACRDGAQGGKHRSRQR